MTPSRESLFNKETHCYCRFTLSRCQVLHVFVERATREEGFVILPCLLLRVINARYFITRYSSIDHALDPSYFIIRTSRLFSDVRSLFGSICSITIVDLTFHFRISQSRFFVSNERFFLRLRKYQLHLTGVKNYCSGLRVNAFAYYFY